MLTFGKNNIVKIFEKIYNIFYQKEKRPLELNNLLKGDKNNNAFLQNLEDELTGGDSFLDLFKYEPNKDYDTHNTDIIIIKMVDLGKDRPEFLEIKDEILSFDCDLDNLDCFKDYEIFQNFDDELKKIALILQDDIFANQIYFINNNFDDGDYQLHYNKQSYINDINELIDYILSLLSDEQLNIYNIDVDYQLTNNYKDLSINVKICIPKYEFYKSFKLDFSDFDYKDILLMVDEIVRNLKKEG